MSRTSLHENKFLENCFKTKTLFTRLIPNVFEENLYYSMAHILIWFIFQNYFFAMIFPQPYQLWDFITPWLVLQFIKQPFIKGFLLGAFASILVESSSSVSFGYFIFLYWVLCSALNYFKDSFSWRSFITWQYSLTACLLLYFAYEVLYIILLGKIAVLSFEYFKFALLRLGISISIGLLLIRVFMNEQSYFSEES